MRAEVLEALQEDRQQLQPVVVLCECTNLVSDHIIILLYKNQVNDHMM